MNEDVIMDDDSKPKQDEDDLEKYNLDEYDNDDATPCMSNPPCGLAKLILSYSNRTI